jgi:hypothetical protein
MFSWMSHRVVWLKFSDIPEERILPPSSVLKMDPGRYFETLMYLYQTTWRHVPEGSIFMATPW